MDRRRIEQTGSFRAHDSHGNDYTVIVFNEVIEVFSQDGRQVEKGLQSLRTTDDQAVNRVEKGHYRLVGSDETDLFCDDPHAP